MHPRSNVELDVERVTRAGGNVADERPKEFAEFFGQEEDEEKMMMMKKKRSQSRRGRASGE